MNPLLKHHRRQMEKKTEYIQIRVSKREKLILQNHAESRYMKMTAMLLYPFKKLLKGEK